MGGTTYLLGGLVVIAATLPAGRAWAQPVAVVLVDGGEEARRQAFEETARGAAEGAGLDVVDPIEWVTATTGRLREIRESRVEAFDELERLLVAARRERAALHLGEALAILSRARALVLQHADVPGAAAWLAEIDVTVGITATQAGLTELAGGALERAATLDPARRLRAAEAPPGLVSRADAIADAVATRPEGTFHIEVDVAGARVFLNDELAGEAPTTVRAPVGSHLLRVEAPGHLPYGRLIEVREGRRAPRRIALSPSPQLVDARTLTGAARQARLESLPELVGRVGLQAVFVVEVGSGAQRRALVTRCREMECGATIRVDDDTHPNALARLLRRADRSGSRASDRAWLLEPPPVIVPPVPWYERWYVWAGVGALAVAGGIVGLAFALRPEPDRELVIRVFPTFEEAP